MVKKKTIKRKTFRQFVANLRKVNEYKACGLLTHTGRVVILDAVDPQDDLEVVCSIFNDIFQQAHGSAKNVGLEFCSEMLINTPTGIIMIRCSGEDAYAHFHVLLVLSGGANLPRVCLELDNFVAVVMKELA